MTQQKKDLTFYVSMNEMEMELSFSTISIKFILVLIEKIIFLHFLLPNINQFTHNHLQFENLSSVANNLINRMIYVNQHYFNQYY